MWYRGTIVLLWCCLCSLPAWAQPAPGVLGKNHGGTGLSSYTLGDLIYGVASTTPETPLGKLADVAVGSHLSSGGVGVAPAWTLSPWLQDGTNTYLGVQRNVCIGTGPTATDALSLCTAPVASATRALVNLSNTALSGGSAAGTYIGANPAACTGDFFNFQVANTSKASLTCAGVFTVTSLTTSLTNTHIFVGNVSNIATDVAASGDVTLATTGAFSVVATHLSSPLPLNQGGTNASLTASNGGIFYSTASAGAILSGTATANQALLSGSSTTPAWSTATYPATTTVSQLLYSPSSNVIAGLATGNNGVLVTGAGGIPAISSTLPSGIAATNMALTTPGIGVATGTSLATTGHIGVNTGIQGAISVFVSGLTASTSSQLTAIQTSGDTLTITGNYSFQFMNRLAAVNMSSAAAQTIDNAATLVVGRPQINPNVTVTNLTNIAVQLGTVSAVAIAGFSEVTDVIDADTGIYWPAANQFGIATAGVDAIRVDASQNVTIQTTKSTTGVRYVCADTNGKLIGQASACVGT